MRASFSEWRRERGSARLGGAALALAATLAAVLLLLGASASGGKASAPCGTNGVFSQTGDSAKCLYTTVGEDTFAVPAGVTSFSMTAIGAAGEAGLPGGAGGHGAKISSTVTIPANTTTLYVNVGAPGGPNPYIAGGEADGGGGGYSSASGGGGGGSSDVSTEANNAGRTGTGGDARLIVAGGGGGGGGGYDTAQYDYGPGGAGGSAGGSGSGAGNGGCASGAGASGGLGGPAGTSSCGGGAGTADAGGSGAYIGTGEGGNGGGGGGGGYLGGAAGGGNFTGTSGGGGGGSSYSSGTDTTIVTDSDSAEVVIAWTVVDPPTAQISAPGDNQTYNEDAVVGTSFSCAEGANGSGLASCKDSNGSTSGTGQLVTSQPGTYQYTVKATSTDGLTGQASISYTVVGPPTASIGSPADDQTYNLNASAPTSFSCTDAVNGPGIDTCTDSNGATSGTGALVTSTAGTFTYTVTPKSKDGQTGTPASISYTVVGPPTASISSPADDQTYNINASVPTSFSCSEAAHGPGIQSCTDSNGSTSGTGALVTSSAGTFTYTVTPKSKDGQTGTPASISYTVVGPPTASISSPIDDQTYNLNESVPTSFSCEDAPHGPGIETCIDSNGAGDGAGELVTSQAGTFTYTVTPTSYDGQTGTPVSISYTVVGPPTASISSPIDDQSFNLDQSVPTSFSCSDAVNGPGIDTCTDSNGSTSGTGALVTSTAGTFSYTVTPKSKDGQTGTPASISYTVVGPPTASISSPGDDQSYNINASVPTSFSCSEAAHGPGIQSCTDSNGSTSGTGALVTSSAGTFTYTVTPVSKDGQTGTPASISYTVVGPPTATISSPIDNQTFNVDQSVPTSFSCTEAANGPGIQSCTDSNGATGGTGSLVTTTVGTFSYTVTPKSKDGQTGTPATIHYTVVGPPTASISSPGDNQTYILYQEAKTSFSCTEALNGPGISSCTDSNGATGGSGSLVTSKAGTFSYTVTARSEDGQTGTATISYTVINTPPDNSVLPAVSGTAQQGQTLQSTTGTWSATPAPVFTYQWLSCDTSGDNCTKIPGATGASYLVGPGDVGHTLRSAVTATNVAESETAQSAQTAVVLPLPPANTVLPAISGTAQQGVTLKASTGLWQNSPTSFTYQWSRCDAAGAGCVSIDNATGSSYQAGESDVGGTLRVTVTAINADAGTPATSEQTAVVLIAAPILSEPPAVSGTPLPGQAVSASTGEWNGSPTTFTYQWLQCDSAGNNCAVIPGATQSGYAPGSTDAGHTLRVTVTATNAGGSTSAISAPSALINPLLVSVAGPVLGTTTNLAPVTGTVLVKLPGSSKFTLISSSVEVPLGSTVDARLGTVSLTTELPSGADQTGQFYDGEFILSQLHSGTVIPTLTGGSFGGCPAAPGKSGAARIASGSKKAKTVVRQLWGNAHGDYTTKGRYGSASVSGTIWLTQDRCDGTYFLARKDNVYVVAYSHPKHRIDLLQGQHILIPAPGF